jgi:hypothetical protein
MEAAMFGDDASRCSNGLTAKKFREATREERVIYRRWLRGAIVFYAVLWLASGVLAVVSYSSTGLMQFTKLSTHATAASPRAQ